MLLCLSADWNGLILKSLDIVVDVTCTRVVPYDSDWSTADRKRHKFICILVNHWLSSLHETSMHILFVENRDK